MKFPQKFSDDQLRDALEIFADEPDMVTKVAAYLRVSPSAISQRVAKLERAAAPMAERIADAVAQDVFDIRKGLQRNYDRVLRVIQSVETNGVAKQTATGDVYMADGVTQLTALLGESRKHSETALKCLEALYRVEEIKAFQDDVIAILAECDPTLRERIMDRIKRRRGVRSAFA